MSSASSQALSRSLSSVRSRIHDIRVRNYEADLSPCRIPLQELLGPAGIGHVTADVTGIGYGVATVTTADGAIKGYDRLVLAVGSKVAKPDLPGLAEFGYDVDTYDGAMRLQAHIRGLAGREADPATATAVVVGAGLTGIETASELPKMLSDALGPGVTPRVILVDRNPHVGSDMGESARPVIEEALADNKVDTMTGAGVAAVDEQSVTLSSGEVIPAATVVWCAGMRANPLTAQFGVPCDRLGRLPVDDYLRVEGVDGVFAAGDVAAAKMDDEHLSVMSCQHGRPMGRYRRLQRDQRPAGCADAVAADPVVCHRPRSRSGRCGVYRGLGPQGRQPWRRGQGDEAGHQRRTHLSSAHRRPCGTPRRGRAELAGPARVRRPLKGVK